jgi:Leucine Rich repeat
MKVLGQLPGLRSVGLRLTKVTDAGLAELAKCRSLTHLELAGTQVTDAGLSAIEQLPNLESLQLGVYNEGAKVTDEGLQIIGRLGVGSRARMRPQGLADLSPALITNAGNIVLRSVGMGNRLSSIVLCNRFR